MGLELSLSLSEIITSELTKAQRKTIITMLFDNPRPQPDQDNDKNLIERWDAEKRQFTLEKK